MPLSKNKDIDKKSCSRQYFLIGPTWPILSTLYDKMTVPTYLTDKRLFSARYGCLRCDSILYTTRNEISVNTQAISRIRSRYACLLMKNERSKETQQQTPTQTQTQTQTHVHRKQRNNELVLREVKWRRSRRRSHQSAQRPARHWWGRVTLSCAARSARQQLLDNLPEFK